MIATPLNPVLSRLLLVQAGARFRRGCRNFRSRRNLLLSVAALLLAAVWLGQSVVTLRSWVPLTLMAYFLWHLLKVAWKRPEEAIAWSSAEREMICGGPFSRREVLA